MATATSWRYTVNIPMYILGKDNEGENVVLYRVNVVLQASDSNETRLTRPPFFVLRRYSQFRQMHAELKNQFPHIMKEKGMLPPPKHTFHVGSNKEMLDKRREELEQWMWRLFKRPEIARSSVMRTFLDFEKALQRAQHYRVTSSPPPLGPPSSSGSPMPYPNSTTGFSQASSEADDLDDARSEVSAPSSLAPSLAQSTSTAAHDWPRSSQRSLFGPSPGQASNSEAVSSAMRLGIRLEQRSDIRKLVEVLQRRVRSAGADLQAAVAEIQQLQANNKALSGRVMELQSQEEKQGENDLERELTKAHEEIASLKAELGKGHVNDREYVQLQEQLAETERARAAANNKLREMELRGGEELGALQERVNALEEELASARLECEALSAKEKNIEGDVAEGTALGPGEQVAEMQQRLEEAESSRTWLLAEVSRLQSTLEEVQAVAQEQKETSRSHHTLLAKEVKKLRGEVANISKAKAELEEKLQAMQAGEGAQGQGENKEEVQQLMDAIASQNDILASKNKELEEKLVTSEEAVTRYRSQAQDLQGQLEFVLSNKQALELQVAELENTVQELRQELDQLSGVNLGLDMQSAELQERLVLLEQGLQASSEQGEEAGQKLAGLTVQNAQLAAANGTLEGELANLKETLARIDQQCKEQGMELAALKQENQSLREQLQVLTGAHGTLQPAMNELEGVETARKRLEDAVKGLEEELKGVCLERDALAEELQLVREGGRLDNQDGGDQPEQGAEVLGQQELSAISIPNGQLGGLLSDRSSGECIGSGILEHPGYCRVEILREREAEVAALREELMRSQATQQAAILITGGLDGTVGDLAVEESVGKRSNGEAEDELGVQLTTVSGTNGHNDMLLSALPPLLRSFGIPEDSAGLVGGSVDGERFLTFFSDLLSRLPSSTDLKAGDLVEEGRGPALQEVDGRIPSVDEVSCSPGRLEHEVRNAQSEVEQIQGLVGPLSSVLDHLRNFEPPEAVPECGQEVWDQPVRLVLNILSTPPPLVEEELTSLKEENQRLLALVDEASARIEGAPDDVQPVVQVVLQVNVESTEQDRSGTSDDVSMSLTVKVTELEGLVQDLVMQKAALEEAMDLLKSELASSLSAKPQRDDSEGPAGEEPSNLVDGSLPEVANVLSALEQEVAALRDDNERLKMEVSSLTHKEDMGNMLLNVLKQVLTEVRGTFHELKQCDTAVMHLEEVSPQGLTSREESAEQFLQHYLQSNDRLELVHTQANGVLRQPATAASPMIDLMDDAAPRAPVPSTGPVFATEVEVRRVFSDVLTELVAKYKQVNELKCDSLLRGAVEGAPGQLSGPTAPPHMGNTQMPGQPDGSPGVISMLGKFLGGPQAQQPLPLQHERYPVSPGHLPQAPRTYGQGPYQHQGPQGFAAHPPPLPHGPPHEGQPFSAPSLVSAAGPLPQPAPPPGAPQHYGQNPLHQPTGGGLFGAPSRSQGNAPVQVNQNVLGGLAGKMVGAIGSFGANLGRTPSGRGHPGPHQPGDSS